MSKVFIISELCSQWGGSVQRAEQMILQSKMAGANAVKVQLWNNDTMPGEDRDHLAYLEMNKDVFFHLKRYADTFNMGFFASAFDKERWEWIKEADCKLNKIASSVVEWSPDLCIDMLRDEPNMIHFVSLGRWFKDDLPFGEEFNNVKYFHCLSEYPHTNGRAVEKMPETFSTPVIGYSDHSIGLEACELAVRRGAKIIEKHFTLDKGLQRTSETAHTCSMTFEELLKFKRFCERQS